MKRICCPTTNAGCELSGPKAPAFAAGYVNITKVHPHDPADTGTAPAAHFNSVMPSGGDCPSPVCGTYITGNTADLCDQWRAPNSNGTPIGWISGSGGVDHNYYAAGSPVALGLQIGFKNLQAYKLWHGNYNYLSTFFQAPTSINATVTDGYLPHPCNGELTTSDQTKYTVLNMSGSYDIFASPDGVTNLPCSFTFGRAVSVATGTGLITLVNCLDPATTGSCSLDITVYRKRASWSNADWIGYYLNQVAARIGSVGAPDVCSGSGTSVTWTWYFNAALFPDLAGQPNYIVTVDVAGNFAFTTWNSFSNLTGGNIPYMNIQETVAVTGTTVTFERKTWTTIGIVVPYTYWQDTHVLITNTISTTYTAAQCLADAMALLAYWNLNDDFVYPWRYLDGFFSVAPLLTYAEVPSNVTLTCDVPCGWTDPNAGQGYDGSVLGKPGQVGASNFSWNQKVWGTCDFGAALISPEYWGAWSGAGGVTSAAMPLCATQWTQNYDARSLRPGRWIIQNPGGGIRVQDWREQAIPRHHQNWARPCGLDAYLLDENFVRCVLSESGPDSAAVFQLDANYPGANGDLLVVIDAGYSGLWTVSSIDLVGNSVTCVKTGPLPAGFNYPTYDSPMLGKRRYPSAGACNPAYTSTEPQGSFLVHTWGFNYRDVGERNRVIALADATCPPGGGAIRANQVAFGLPAEVTAYSTSAKSSADYDLTGCLQTIYPSPFPNSFTADEIYGAQWLSTVQQWMAEIYWQTPHPSCAAIGDFIADSTDYNWSEDGSDGVFCHNSPDGGTPNGYWYPQRPWVEAQQNPTAGAPTVPGDVVVGWYQWSELQGATLPYSIPKRGVPVPPTIPLPSGDLANPLSDPKAPWAIWYGECGCITGGGNFGGNYAAQMP